MRILIGLGFPLFAALFTPPSSSDILVKMDGAAAKFVSMTSSVSRDSYTKVIDDHSVASGTFALRKSKAGELQMRMDIIKPDPANYAFHGKKAEIYLPKINTVREYDLGKFSDQVDQFLLLGFGASGHDLQAKYDVKTAGEETVAGQHTFHLELTPKSEKMRQSYSRIDLWMSESGEYPVQQKIVEASGNYTLVTYQDVKLNAPLNKDALNLQLPKNVKREHPQS
jgi:outer membrane lipoprotein-sorting protein